MTKTTQIGIAMPHFEFCKNISLCPLPIIALNYDKCQMIITLYTIPMKRLANASLKDYIILAILINRKTW